MEELLYRSEVYAIVGAAVEVHRQLGVGFLEPIYQEALEVEFRSRDIPFTPQAPLRIHYGERLLEKVYKPDFLCYETVIVELKALASLGRTEEAQVINYLKASRLRVGVLLNFGRRADLNGGG